MDSSEGHPEDKLKEHKGLDSDLIIEESRTGVWGHGGPVVIRLLALSPVTVLGFYSRITSPPQRRFRHVQWWVTAVGL